ncbi:unnamed protein product [Arctia plantaginis]|uniref:Uncharacterized protein n=1 Tax=Arctia plantaginis TaxID=874455 RepID=A0A8S1BJH4_ARCPL|nr:unnamed protein product [Arctia plantaginis]CAB3258789.1 unnamed protein product [Arctia plantaginis]
MFAYSENHRWNCYEYEATENALVEAGINARILDYAPGRGGFPLNKVDALPNANIQDLNGLVTNGIGRGWREGVHMRLTAHPPEMPYADCANRQLFVHDIDRVEALEHDDRIQFFNAWGLPTLPAAFLPPQTDMERTKHHMLVPLRFSNC